MAQPQLEVYFNDVYRTNLVSIMYVICSAAPTDYTGTSADLTFDGGTDRQCVTVPIINDDILEDTESFTASLTTSDSAVTLNPDLARVDISEGSIDGKSTTNNISN